MKKPITRIEMHGETYPIGIQMVEKNELKSFLDKDPIRVELFIDEDGVMYVVDKGDLEVYWRRRGGEEIREKKEIGFLEDIKLEL